MNNTLFESLENQTAPESTRGLFDSPPVEKKKDDKRRSFGAEQTKMRPLSFQLRSHQRSRSASDFSFINSNNRRNNLALQTLAEEQISQRDRKNVDIDSLNDIINTLKNLPPIISSPPMETKPFGHRKQQSMSSFHSSENPQVTNNKRLSYNKPTAAGSDNTTNFQTIEKKRRSKRSQSVSNDLFHSMKKEGNIFDTLSRDEALAEAEAKLMGTFDQKGKDTRRNRQSQPNIIPKSASSSLLPKHTSMPPLNENEASSSDRRISFNKPLNLANSNKRLSRNLDSDWRSSAPLVVPNNSSNNRNSFHLVPFTPTRVNFARDDANPHQRRPLFVAHLPFSSLTPLFRSRQLSRGILRVNKRNRSDAYVYCEELDDDIYICGSRDRNRALEGDVVAVRLVDVDKVLLEKKEKEEAKLIRNGGQAKVRLPDEEDENEIIFGGEDDINVIKPKYAGVVVAILERAQNQVFSGTLTLMRPNNKRAEEEKAAEEARKSIHGKDAVIEKEAPRIVWFKATDKRVPLIAIPIEQAPSDFVKNSSAYSSRLFVGSMKRWPITSLHPFGTLEKELGSVYDISTQTKAILADNNVTDSEFSEAVQSCLPSIPFNLVTDDSRRDLRDNTFVFTIDPKGSNVLDDAFSVTELDNNLWEVGVHVSDIGYFIKSHSALDKEARARGVRVDLVRSHVPMIPEVLTEEITNLNVNKSRFAFSVIWKINRDGTIVDTWFGKTIVRSSAQLTYDEAQTILESSDDTTLLAKNIHSLYQLSTVLHEQRADNGLFTQMHEELEYKFDQGNDEEPITVSMHQKLPAAFMVKEFLFLANKSVAQKISSHFPDHALLRRQSPPSERKMNELCAYAAQHLGVQLSATNSATLESSIQSIEDPKLRRIVSSLVLNTMQPPKYFCSGCVDISKYSHYSLNVSLFTHFTAPSRRFADIIVHRQLEAALESGEKRFSLDKDTIQKLAQHCNVKKEAAIYARQQSSMMFLTKHMNKLSQLQRQPGTEAVMFREAIVVAVFDQYFDVIIPELNLQKRIHLACLPVWRSDYNAQKQSLTMFWRKGVCTSTGEKALWSISDEEDEDIDEDALLEEMRHSHPSSPQQEEEEDYKMHSNNYDYGTVVSQLDITPPKSVSTPVILTPRPESTRSSNRRASIVRARLSDSTAFSTEQGYQTIRALDKIRVVLVNELGKTPPVIRVLAANPFS